MLLVKVVCDFLLPVPSEIRPLVDTASPARPGPTGPALLGYIEDMLLELAHLASAGGETGLAASLAIAAIQCGARLRAVERDA